MNTKQKHGGELASFACTLRAYSDIVIDFRWLLYFLIYYFFINASCISDSQKDQEQSMHT